MTVQIMYQCFYDNRKNVNRKKLFLYKIFKILIYLDMKSCGIAGEVFRTLLNGPKGMSAVRKLNK